MYPRNTIEVLIQALTAKIRCKTINSLYKTSHNHKGVTNLKLKQIKNKDQPNHNPKLKIVLKNKTNFFQGQGQKEITILD